MITTPVRRIRLGIALAALLLLALRARVPEAVPHSVIFHTSPAGAGVILTFPGHRHETVGVSGVPIPAWRFSGTFKVTFSRPGFAPVDAGVTTASRLVEVGHFPYRGAPIPLPADSVASYLTLLPSWKQGLLALVGLVALVEAAAFGQQLKRLHGRLDALGELAPGHVYLSPGQEIAGGRYRIERIVGQGGMGVVYEASTPEGRRVAVKELLAMWANPQQEELARRRFAREAELLQRLDPHPGLVTLHDVFAEGPQDYIVMDLVEGETLADRLEARDAPFDTAEVAAWVRQLGETLSFLHRHQPPILFRDLKPANVMVQLDGTLRLIDFGVSRLLYPARVTSSCLKAIGSLGYGPPEQFSGSTDVRSDVFSLGATAYNLLTRRLPPLAGSPLSGLPAEPQRVLERMMAPSPEARYATVQEAVDAFCQGVPR
ncbi:MAG: serine/threonine-protein kinase [Candidatus Xenobia bacterium]